MASPKQKFDAAIKVIHSLPKEGPFQPSNEMMLTFYGFFKQATEGPCKLPKPNFWEIVKKAKWDAWHKLGNMNEEEAMLNYVEELKKTLKICSAKWSEMAKNDDPRIVEAMPQTQVVGDFVDSLGTFYELVDEEPPKELNVHKEKQNGQNNNSEHELDSVEAAVLNMSERVESALKTFSHFEDETNKLDDLAGLHDEPLANGDLMPDIDITERRSNSRGTNSIQSSDSEDEFCDTSDRPVQPVEEVVKVRKQEVQMSTPLKKEAGKSNRVHFSSTAKGDVNGRISPIIPDHLNENYVQLSHGFPHIAGHVNGQISDSMLVNANDRSDGSASTLSDLSSQNEFSRLDYSSNNSNVNRPVDIVEGGGEENEPPGSSGGGDRERRDDKSSAGSSRSTRYTGISRGLSGTYSHRAALLTGGAGGGSGGEENPSHSQPAPQDEMNDRITLILVRLQQDMNSVLDRLNRLETRVTDAQRQTEARRISDSMFSWWPFQNRTGRTAFFVLVWPIIVHLLISYLFRRRRRQR